jgi:hypothetical protein
MRRYLLTLPSEETGLFEVANGAEVKATSGVGKAEAREMTAEVEHLPPQQDVMIYLTWV